MKRVLIFYISVNSGHHIAAKSIENALLKLDDSLEILTVNALHYISPLLEKFILKTYMGVVKNNPELWEYLYDNATVKEKLTKFRDFAHRFNSSRLVKLVDEFKPDVAVCTQAYPCGVLSSVKALRSDYCPIVAVVTDYVVHGYWMLDHVDLFIVPTTMSARKLVEGDIGEDKVQVLGIPVDPIFNKKLDRKLLRSWYGIGQNETVILIMGGGQGLIPIREIVMALGEVRHPIHIIAVAGRNRILQKELEKAKRLCRTPLTIHGYVSEIDALMEMSDLLISKPGGLTSSEALVKRLPMIIFKPLPGQESKNTEFLVASRAALKVDQVDEIPKLVEQLLKDPIQLDAIRQNIERLRKPNAALDIGKAVLAIANQINAHASISCS